jgi:hypothetical protein
MMADTTPAVDSLEFAGTMLENQDVHEVSATILIEVLFSNVYISFG